MMDKKYDNVEAFASLCRTAARYERSQKLAEVADIVEGLPYENSLLVSDWLRQAADIEQRECVDEEN